MSEREKTKMEYRDKLVNRFKYNNDIRKIKKTHLPKYILNARKKGHVMRESKYRKQENRKINNEAEYDEPIPERQKKVIGQE